MLVIMLFLLSDTMRPLTDEETKIFFEKLTKYIGENIKMLIDREDGKYCFRLHRERVYYVSEKIMKQVILSLSQTCLLNIYLCCCSGFQRGQRKPGVSWNMFWEVHEDQKVVSKREH